MHGSTLWALFMTIAIVAWMATGDVIIGGRGSNGEAAAPAVTETAAANASDSADEAAGTPAEAGGDFAVRVEEIRAEDRVSTLTGRGRSDAHDRLDVRAETDGLIEELLANKGDAVAPGDPLCIIETGARNAQLLQAQAQLEQAQHVHDARTKPADRGVTAQTK